jgi:UDP:flavonoid glycosyltransferase YjiC (YdhE family)
MDVESGGNVGVTKSLVFAPETINIAETTRMIEIAKRCRHKFRCIFFGYADTFAYLIEQEGFEFRRMEPWLSEADIEHLWQVDRMEKWGDPFSSEQLATRVQGEVQLFNEWKPAAVVIGFTLSVTISARVAGIPLIYVMPFSYTEPFFAAKLADVPELFDVPLTRLFPEKMRKNIVSYWGLHTKMWMKPFRTVAESYGLNGFVRTIDIYQGDYNLVASAAELTGVEQLPPRWKYVGPIFAKLRGDVPDEIEQMPRDQPIIYLAMGSSANLEILEKVLRSFAGLPYRVICPMKFHLQHSRIEVPRNVHLFDWLPAHKVNPLVDLAIIHGGEGTVQTACMSGKPFIGIGLQPEQEANIDYCVRFGNALRMKRRDLSVSSLTRAIEKVMTSGEMQAKAVELKQILERYDGPQNVSDFIFNVIGE